MRFRRRAACLLMLLGALLASPCGPARADQAPSVDAKIEIVWPHDPRGNAASVGAPLVNVEVYLFERGTLNPVPCGFSNQVTLHWAQNWTSHVGRPVPNSPRGSGQLIPVDDADVQAPDGTETNVAVGQPVVRTVNGRSFPAWVINDVPVDPFFEIGGTVTTYFLAEVAGADYRTNVWAHGLDQRALLPQPAIPEGVASSTPDQVDSLIPIVWPHDRQGRAASVAAAPLANVAVDLAVHPSDMGRSRWTSVGLGFGHPVRLYRSLNNGYLEPHAVQPEIVTHDETWGPSPGSWPRYEFDDVDVAATQNPANTYYFAAYVDGSTTHPAIWAHGANSSTYFPQRDVPASSGATCP